MSAFEGRWVWAQASGVARGEGGWGYRYCVFPQLPPLILVNGHFLGSRGYFWALLNAQKLLRCPKVVKLRKNFRAGKLQPPAPQSTCSSGVATGGRGAIAPPPWVRLDIERVYIF